jgi:Protein of unknown function (DUF2892)
MFKKNVGDADRAIRIMLGLALISLAFVGPRTIWGLVGVIPLATAFIRICPFYALLGLSTCPKK